MTLLECVQKDIAMLRVYDTKEGVDTHVKHFLIACEHRLQTCNPPLFVNLDDYVIWRKKEVANYEKVLKNTEK